MPVGRVFESHLQFEMTWDQSRPFVWSWFLTNLCWFWPTCNASRGHDLPPPMGVFLEMGLCLNWLKQLGLLDENSARTLKTMIVQWEPKKFDDFSSWKEDNICFFKIMEIGKSCLFPREYRYGLRYNNS